MRYFQKIASHVGRRLIRYAAGDSGILRHAIHEWAATFPEKDEDQDEIGECVFDAAALFSLYGHSGTTAPYTIGLIERVLRYQPLGPLTGEDDEWFCYADEFEGEGMEFFQNKRDSRVFKNGRDGAAYMIEGRIFRDPDGSCYTGSGSKIDMPPFPCYPPEPVYIDVDEDGNEILELSTSVETFGNMQFSRTPGGGIHVTWETDGIEIDRDFSADEFTAGIVKMIGGFKVDGVNDQILDDMSIPEPASLREKLDAVTDVFEKYGFDVVRDGDMLRVEIPKKGNENGE